MEPFNGHWVLTANTIWQALFSTVGLSSYTPYLVPLHLAHIFTAAAVYWGVRRIAGPAAGLAAGSIILVNRGAAEMIYQGHAVEAVSSTMFGAWALVLTLAGGRGRLIAAAILMTLAVASHTTSLPFIVAIGVYLVFVPGRPRQLWVVVPALVAYATWYLMWGRWDGNSVRIALHVGWFRDVLEFVRDGVSFAMGALSGTGAEVGIVLITVLVLATLWQLLGDGGFLYPALAGLAGLFAMYLLTAVVSLEHPTRTPLAPRYTYPAAVFLAVAVASWYGSRPRIRPLNAVPILVVVTWALLTNAMAMRWWVEEWYPLRGQETRAAITVVLEEGGTPLLRRDLRNVPTSDPFLRSIPGPDLLRERIAQLGSPLDASDLPGTERLPADVYDRVRADILASAAALE